MLWRVTCPMEQRYVVAPTLERAVQVAVKKWPRQDTRYELKAIEMITDCDPWVVDGKEK